MSEIENLVFEGGGVLGFAYIGVIEVLEEKGILKQCKCFAGSSAGAITAALLACGATANILENALNTLDATELFDTSAFPPANFYRLWHEGGWTKGKKLELWIGDLLAVLCDGNRSITFAEVFEKFQTSVIVTGTCLETRKTEYFSKENNANMPLAIAVRISAGYPCVYPMVKFFNMHWWDGGIGDNYPIHVFDDKQSKHCSKRIPNQRTLGFKLVSQVDDAASSVPKPIDNVQDALLSVGTMILEMSRSVHVKEIDWKRSVLIDIGTIGAIKFDISDEEKQFLIENGRRATENFISTLDSSDEMKSE